MKMYFKTKWGWWARFHIAVRLMFGRYEVSSYSYHPGVGASTLQLRHKRFDWEG